MLQFQVNDKVNKVRHSPNLRIQENELLGVVDALSDLLNMIIKISNDKTLDEAVNELLQVSEQQRLLLVCSFIRC